MKYTPVIGMEVHAELKTESKMFCSCPNGMGMEKEPNKNVCPVCTAQPGALPTPNRKAIEYVQKVGAALEGKLATRSKFDRKNYFYPDLPKGYQISQYDEPFVGKGKLTVGEREIGITRVHMEEDTGKSQHPKGVDYTLVDLNRSSVSLMELVTEPDIESGSEARMFCQQLQQILRYLDVSDADMEKGQMRCEANISLYKEGEGRLSGTKVEVKNLNSFKAVERAIAYEIARQTEVLESGQKVVQETRGWDENKQATVSQRLKESAHDYRYFPEPDIPPFEFSEDYLESVRRSLPELPQAKKKRFEDEYGVSGDQASILTVDKYFAGYFESVIGELDEKHLSGELTSDIQKARKLAVNYLITELRKYLIETGEDIRSIKISAENYAELIGVVADGKINSSAAQTVLLEMYKTGADPTHVIDEKNLKQMDDENELSQIIDEVIAKNEPSVNDYKNGKQNALQYLVGQVMATTRGKANPQTVMKILKKKL